MHSVNADTHTPWLSPSAALTRFTPPADTALGGGEPAAWQRTRFGFRVGQFHLLIKPDTISEVVIQTPIYPLPNVPAWFLGVLNLRGKPLPLFDLYHILEADNSSQGTPRVLVLDQGNAAVGLPIAELPQSVTLDRTLRTMPPLHDALQDHVSVSYAVEDTIWLDFDHQSFFTMLGAQIVS